MRSLAQKTRRVGGIVKIDAETMAVLESATASGAIVTLPPKQLDRKLYEKVNSVLAALGGKWNKTARGHVFADDPAEALELAILTGEATDTKQEFQFFETPRELAIRMVEMADVSDKHMTLEPSAGAGNILDRLPQSKRLHFCEIQAALFIRAERRCPEARFVMANFLDYKPSPTYDRIVANPPFSRQQDIDHVRHMLDCLKVGGILVTVMSAGINFRTNKKTADFLDELHRHDVCIEELEDGTFRESGTNAKAVLVSLTKKA